MAVSQQRLGLVPGFIPMVAKVGIEATIRETTQWSFKNTCTDTNPMVKLQSENFCDDTDLVTNLVTESKTPT
jgi:hypothetical protein